MIRESIAVRDSSVLLGLVTRARAELLTEQTCSLTILPPSSCHKEYFLDSKEEVHLEVVNFEERKPVVRGPALTEKKELVFKSAIFNEDEHELLQVLRSFIFPADITAKLSRVDENGEEECPAQILSPKYLSCGDITIPPINVLAASTTYRLRVRIECCRWKECLDHGGKTTLPVMAQCLKLSSSFVAIM